MAIAAIYYPLFVDYYYNLFNLHNFQNNISEMKKLLTAKNLMLLVAFAAIGGLIWWTTKKQSDSTTSTGTPPPTGTKVPPGSNLDPDKGKRTAVNARYGRNY